MLLCFSRNARRVWRQAPPGDSPHLPRRPTEPHHAGRPPFPCGGCKWEDTNYKCIDERCGPREGWASPHAALHPDPLHHRSPRRGATRPPQWPQRGAQSTHSTPLPSRSPQRTVVHMGRKKGCCRLGHRDEGCAATGGGHARPTQQSNKGCRDGGPRGEVGRPHCRQRRASRSRHCHGQGGGGAERGRPATCTRWRVEPHNKIRRSGWPPPTRKGRRSPTAAPVLPPALPARNGAREPVRGRQRAGVWALTASR